MNRLHGDAEGQEHINRLAQETSPYLLQHAHNPVDWCSQYSGCRTPTDGGKGAMDTTANCKMCVPSFRCSGLLRY